MQEMTLFEKFDTESNDKAEELAKYGPMSDARDMKQTRASKVQQKKEEDHAALQFAVSFHCLVKEWNDFEELKPKEEK